MALHHRVIAAATSGQSHLIVAAVLMAFIVWSTLRGTLGNYLADLGFGKKGIANPTVGSAIGAAGSSGGSGIGGLGAALPSIIPSLPPL